MSYQKKSLGCLIVVPAPGRRSVGSASKSVRFRFVAWSTGHGSWKQRSKIEDWQWSWHWGEWMRVKRELPTRRSQLYISMLHSHQRPATKKRVKDSFKDTRSQCDCRIEHRKHISEADSESAETLCPEQARRLSQRLRQVGLDVQAPKTSKSLRSKISISLEIKPTQEEFHSITRPAEAGPFFSFQLQRCSLKHCTGPFNGSRWTFFVFSALELCCALQNELEVLQTQPEVDRFDIQALSPVSFIDELDPMSDHPQEYNHQSRALSLFIPVMFGVAILLAFVELFTHRHRGQSFCADLEAAEGPRVPLLRRNRRPRNKSRRQAQWWQFWKRNKTADSGNTPSNSSQRPLNSVILAYGAIHGIHGLQTGTYQRSPGSNPQFPYQMITEETLTVWESSTVKDRPEVLNLLLDCLNGDADRRPTADALQEQVSNLDGPHCQRETLQTRILLFRASHLPT
ncbi:uncharacterized protein MYCFIDRAFT_175440 [Pseudocercospora fijiensis CIRAD86]|uniref:Uncharacterized protein n=1 Tax=Pseudocercospora fijiensis (strain CIRAD86) TaxID=383855 RepID=M3AWL6_PSEFD|nr:uncharacterized protein MYCFIDRAFT_175440 [Pseudocercospora fijiensis CIRAD86]EME81852.1 hypothetical protein MYCFIDRAFT_175440 [Pseudocercospora fijiensis CIRAD86]